MSKVSCLCDISNFIFEQEQPCPVTLAIREGIQHRALQICFLAYTSRYQDVIYRALVNYYLIIYLFNGFMVQ